MDAVNAPVRKSRRELHMGDIPIEQKADVDSDQQREPDIVVAQPSETGYTDDLAFNEEPVTIRLEPSAEKFASPWVPCWVNGKGAEVLVEGKWHEWGYLPVARQITTKRKYVEVLLRSKRDSIQTNVIERDNEDPRNLVNRSTSAVAMFSIIEDRNPRGAEWATELRRRAG